VARSATSAPSTTTAPSTTGTNGQPNFLIVYRRGPAWIEGKPVTQQPLKEHFKFLVGLYEQGILRFAGPFGDDTGGAAALSADSEEAVRAIVAADPAVTSGVMIVEVHAWKLVHWETFIKK
jgi:uncharacterized protein YciI